MLRPSPPSSRRTSTICRVSFLNLALAFLLGTGQCLDLALALLLGTGQGCQGLSHGLLGLSQSPSSRCSVPFLGFGQFLHSGGQPFYPDLGPFLGLGQFLHPDFGPFLGLGQFLHPDFGPFLGLGQFLHPDFGSVSGLRPVPPPGPRSVFWASASSSIRAASPSTRTSVRFWASASFLNDPFEFPDIPGTSQFAIDITDGLGQHLGLVGIKNPGESSQPGGLVWHIAPPRIRSAQEL
jgi:hypothetical protein